MYLWSSKPHIVRELDRAMLCGAGDQRQGQSARENGNAIVAVELAGQEGGQHSPAIIVLTVYKMPGLATDLYCSLRIRLKVVADPPIPLDLPTSQ